MTFACSDCRGQASYRIFKGVDPGLKFTKSIFQTCKQTTFNTSTVSAKGGCEVAKDLTEKESAEGAGEEAMLLTIGLQTKVIPKLTHA